jgi:uncharacterized repeat protein (TIGR03803 family)
LNGCGEIFKIDTAENFSVFFSFTGKSECWAGCWPLAPLTIDSTGNLYGTTFLGGSRDCNDDKLNLQAGLENSDCGVIFKLDQDAKETVLHTFSRARRDGDFPNPGLVLDKEGNLYGTALAGGINTNGGNGGAGTIFKLDPTGNETVLFYFQEFVNGLYPNGGLVRDRAGNIYGTLQGSDSNLSAFKLNTKGNLSQLAVIYGLSMAGLTWDGAGNFYGTLHDGSMENENPNCSYFSDNFPCGTVFEVDASRNVTTLYKFSGGTDGGSPYAGLVRDSAGNLYGTTAYGGTVNAACPAGCGVVFKITP